LRYFVDAEFNGFGGDLISIALVPEDESRPSFYGATHCAEPTPWVADNVMPALQITPVDRHELTHSFAAFLHNDEDPRLIADWPEDIAHAARLLITGPGRMEPVRNINFHLVDPVLLSLGTHETSVSLQPHNALADARALRALVLSFEAGHGGRSRATD